MNDREDEPLGTQCERQFVRFGVSVDITKIAYRLRSVNGSFLE